MKKIDELLTRNRRWAEEMARENPGLLETLRAGQAPEILWIGCSDSRVPPSVITGAGPGTLFMHRNIANLAMPEDAGFQATLEYAVQVLGIRDVVVAGHYGCGGVYSACTVSDIPERVSRWTRQIREIRDRNLGELETIGDPSARFDRLVELNVVAQVRNIENSEILKQLENRGDPVRVHGLVYDLSDGRLRRLV